MTRSPLAYPLTRSVDGDAGGAADLQTDVMRFMAILGLCLVAIFALVQSIPLVPEPPTPKLTESLTPPQSVVAVPQPIVVARPPAKEATPKAQDSPVLTRPKWQPKFTPETTAATQAEAVSTPQPAVAAETEPHAPVASEQGFTLRFESDLALSRLVAANRVGFYALAAGRSKRMTVSNSRISFWDASAPNTFHEMEAATVPGAVIDALARAGTDTSTVDWGVTLPGELSRQLDALMRENPGGSLVIDADGQLRLETT